MPSYRYRVLRNGKLVALTTTRKEAEGEAKRIGGSFEPIAAPASVPAPAPTQGLMQKNPGPKPKAKAKKETAPVEVLFKKGDVVFDPAAKTSDFRLHLKSIIANTALSVTPVLDFDESMGYVLSWLKENNYVKKAAMLSPVLKATKNITDFTLITALLESGAVVDMGLQPIEILIPNLPTEGMPDWNTVVYEITDFVPLYGFKTVVQNVLDAIDKQYELLSTQGTLDSAIDQPSVQVHDELVKQGKLELTPQGFLCREPIRLGDVLNTLWKLKLIEPVLDPRSLLPLGTFDPNLVALAANTPYSAKALEEVVRATLVLYEMQTDQSVRALSVDVWSWLQKTGMMKVSILRDPFQPYKPTTDITFDTIHEALLASGKFAAAAAPAKYPDTPAFWAWFKHSQVVDANGKPLVVYHGSPLSGFTVFSKKQIDAHHNGFFFTDSRDMAASYSEDAYNDPTPSLAAFPVAEDTQKGFATFEAFQQALEAFMPAGHPYDYLDSLAIGNGIAKLFGTIYQSPVTVGVYPQTRLGPKIVDAGHPLTSWFEDEAEFYKELIAKQLGYALGLPRDDYDVAKRAVNVQIVEILRLVDPEHFKQKLQQIPKAELERATKRFDNQWFFNLMTPEQRDLILASALSSHAGDYPETVVHRYESALKTTRYSKMFDDPSKSFKGDEIKYLLTFELSGERANWVRRWVAGFYTASEDTKDSFINTDLTDALYRFDVPYDRLGQLPDEIKAQILEEVNARLTTSTKKSKQNKFQQPGVASFFLSLQNPLVVDGGGAQWNYIPWQGARSNTDGIAHYAEKNGYDGVIFKNIKDYGGYSPNEPPANVYIAFSPTQIKHAVLNDGNFSETKADVRNPRARRTR